jgi:hypothetical protein
MNPYENDDEYNAMRQLAEDSEKRLRNDWINVLKTESGKRMIISILEFTGYQRSPFDKHGGVTNINIGKMEVGQFVQSMCTEHAPEEWLAIIRDGVHLFQQDRNLISIGETNG